MKETQTNRKRRTITNSTIDLEFEKLLEDLRAKKALGITRKRRTKNDPGTELASSAAIA